MSRHAKVYDYRYLSDNATQELQLCIKDVIALQADLRHEASAPQASMIAQFVGAGVESAWRRALHTPEGLEALSQTMLKVESGVASLEYHTGSLSRNTLSNTLPELTELTHELNDKSPGVKRLMPGECNSLRKALNEVLSNRLKQHKSVIQGSKRAKEMYSTTIDYRIMFESRLVKMS